ncbi:endonuclease [Flavobacterium sp.]|uniref:endonuclease n=1 Tax=Flavobacterium sp. TaxID=239 RepID=UPI0035285BE0
MKTNFTLILIALSTVVLAQIPTGYYNSATGSGYALKTQLKNIIDHDNDGLSPEYEHNDQGYSALWTLFANENNAFKDIYDDNDGTIYDMYSEKIGEPELPQYQFTPVTDQCGNYSAEGDCYNREHLVPQSYFDHYATNPMKNDPFHAVPSDGYVNGQRNNLPFGEVNSASYTSYNGSKKGANVIDAYSTYSGTVFEPIDEFKGDIARAYFYFATRYEDLMDNFYSGADAASCQAKNMFDGSTNKVFSDAFILRLIKWHLDDPVSQKEINQNNAIFNFQNNRNPYIDHPEYVCQIWQAQCATLNTNTFALENTTIYPNPSNNGIFTIATTANLDTITVYAINGQQITIEKNPLKVNNGYVVSNLPSGFYFITVSANGVSETKKVIVN